MAEKRYKLEELKVGMRVTVKELSDVLDTYIILINIESLGFDNVIGDIAYIGKELTPESTRIVMNHKTFGVFNESGLYYGKYSYDD